jgi:hypothetical protein
VFIAKLIDHQPGCPHDVESFGGLAMHKFGAKLNGHGGTGIVDGQDAPADAVASLDNRGVDMRHRQLSRSGQSGRARADD